MIIIMIINNKRGAMMRKRSVKEPSVNATTLICTRKRKHTKNCKKKIIYLNVTEYIIEELIKM